MLKETQSAGTYLSIIGGKFRKQVSETTPGAIRREWETKDGKSGVKWEKEYESVTGKISGINFYEGDYGKNITIFIKDGEEDYGISMGVATPYAEDLMKKLPAVVLEKTLTLTPYDFTTENGKRIRGVTVYQDGKKYDSFFYNKEKKEIINGAPKPENPDDMDSEDWKIYFTQLRKFVIKYITDNIIPKFDKGEKKAKDAYDALPGVDPSEF